MIELASIDYTSTDYVCIAIIAVVVWLVATCFYSYVVRREQQ